VTVTRVDKDYERLSITFAADFDAPLERVWQLWADPRQLERWWGPPSFPATVQEHDLTPGGTVTFFMTGPDRHRHRGFWRIASVDMPKSLEFINVQADENGAPAEDMPTSTIHVQLSERDGGTQMVMRAVFDSREQMDRFAEQGSVEGLRLGLDQMDALLAA
jgi:uncharacterized protein YndB with AHSA1/START domain